MKPKINREPIFRSIPLTPVLKVCMALRKDLSEKEVNWERGRRSTYGYSKKLDTTIVRLMRMINEERGLPDPFRKTPFVFTGTNNPILNQKLEEFVNERGTPDLTDVLDILREQNNAFKFPMSEAALQEKGERIATKLITGIQKQRMRNERELFLEFAEEHGCPLSADPALTDVALAHKLERNRQIRTRKEDKALRRRATLTTLGTQPPPPSFGSVGSEPVNFTHTFEFRVSVEKIPQ